jgi:hypothetical protein
LQCIWCKQANKNHKNKNFYVQIGDKKKKKNNELIHLNNLN